MLPDAGMVEVPRARKVMAGVTGDSTVPLIGASDL